MDDSVAAKKHAERINNLHTNVVNSLSNIQKESLKETTEPTALEQAQAIIYGDREQTYGSPDKNLKVIAQYWTVHLNATYGKNLCLTVDDVCGMMVLLKQARLDNSPKHRDSLVDLIGYAALKDRCDRLDSSKAVPDVPVSDVIAKQIMFDCTKSYCHYPKCSCNIVLPQQVIPEPDNPVPSSPDSK